MLYVIRIAYMHSCRQYRHSCIPMYMYVYLHVHVLYIFMYICTCTYITSLVLYQKFSKEHLDCSKGQKISIRLHANINKFLLCYIDEL